jgi:hypothetical protein
MFLMVQMVYAKLCKSTHLYGAILRLPVGFVRLYDWLECPYEVALNLAHGLGASPA